MTPFPSALTPLDLVTQLSSWPLQESASSVCSLESAKQLRTFSACHHPIGKESRSHHHPFSKNFSIIQISFPTSSAPPAARSFPPRRCLLYVFSTEPALLHCLRLGAHSPLVGHCTSLLSGLSPLVCAPPDLSPHACQGYCPVLVLSC